MRGIILAGGTGSRLEPLTQITNKHLLPVYDRPMIYFAIEQLAGAGIDRIQILCAAILVDGSFGAPHPFRDAYGVEVEALRPDNPFVTDSFERPH